MNVSRRALSRGLWVLTLLVCAAFHARATTALVEHALLDPTLPSAPPPPAPAAPPPTSAAAQRTAAPILSRNVFDSRTGPLSPTRTPSTATTPRVHPLEAPICEDLIVASTAVARDPRWSTAVVQKKGEPHGKLRRIGDPVGPHEVRYIGYNRSRGSPAVWFVEEGALCQSFVFGKAAPPPPKKKARPKSAKRPPRRRPTRSPRR